MMKIDVRFVVGGKAYKLKEEVALTLKKAALTVTAAGVIAFGGFNALAAVSLDESAVEYEHVFIGEDGVSTTAVGAINKLNDNVDYRDLIHLFEERNGVHQAGNIEAGMYYVPVLDAE